MKKNLSKLIEEKEQYDSESQKIIDTFVFRKSEIAKISDMKSSEGWKVIDKKIREELQNRIEELVKDDAKIQTLIDLLKVADTRKSSLILEQEISSLLPE